MRIDPLPGGRSIAPKGDYRPIDDLPNEILIIIIRYAVLILTHASAPASTRARLPIELSCVSKRFRTLSLVVPELWSFVYLPQPSRLASTNTQQAADEYVKRFCDRAEPLPMHFDVAMHHAEEVVKADMILRRNAARVRALTVRTTEALPTCIGTQYEFSQLEQLHLISLNWPRDRAVRLIAPRLRSLHCIGIVPIVAMGDLQSLDELVLRDFHVLRITRLALILSRWANIRTLNLRRWTLEPEDMGFVIPKRNMPNLTHLTFLKMGQDALRGALAMIDAPNLHSLVVEDVEDPMGGWLDQSWLQVVLRRMENLTYLRLHKFHKRDGPCNLESILRVAPNLTHLVLSDYDLMAFTTVEQSEDADELAPSLATLEVDGKIWPWSDFLGFLRRRVRTLRKVCVPKQCSKRLETDMGGATMLEIKSLDHEIDRSRESH